MKESIRIAGLSGSLREKSFNSSLLRAIPELLPDGVMLNIVHYADLPMYNQDLDLPSAGERPEPVQVFRNSLSTADVILIVSPEYNYSIPGALKNAIDWASRGKDSPITGKVAGLMGVTTGMWGTIRMQQAFRPVFQYLNLKVVNQPEILIARAKEKFDSNGNFTDDTGRSLISQYLQALKELSLQQHRASQKAEIGAA